MSAGKERQVTRSRGATISYCTPTRSMTCAIARTSHMGTDDREINCASLPVGTLRNVPQLNMFRTRSLTFMGADLHYGAARREELWQHACCFIRAASAALRDRRILARSVPGTVELDARPTRSSLAQSAGELPLTSTRARSSKGTVLEIWSQILGGGHKREG